jgi:hypothetical protein
MAFFKQEQKEEIEINFIDIPKLQQSINEIFPEAQVFPKDAIVVVRFDNIDEISQIDEIFSSVLQIKAVHLELNFNSTRFSDSDVGEVMGSFLQKATQFAKINFIFSNIDYLPGIESIASSIKTSSQELKFNFDFSYDVIKEREIELLTNAIKERSTKFVLDLSEIQLTKKSSNCLLDCLISNSNFLLFISEDDQEAFPELYNEVSKRIEAHQSVTVKF